MNDWMRRIRDAVFMGLIWAALWAAVGALIGIVDSGRSLDQLWLGPAIGMQPGFLAGVLFSTLLAFAARGRRLDAASLSTVAACGAMAGLVVGVLPFVINQPPSEVPLWLVGAVVIGSMTLLSAISAAGSLALARSVRADRGRRP